MASQITKNVLGGVLEGCCMAPKTGFFRDGYCNTHPEDTGMHFVCAEMTSEFLTFSKSVGNDLSTPRPEFEFPGLKPGNRWCLCALRWVQAYEAGVAPKLVLQATHEDMLKIVPLEVLAEYGIDVI
jgi:uncharacterized protein (DUF2237 family)